MIKNHNSMKTILYSKQVKTFMCIKNLLYQYILKWIRKFILSVLIIIRGNYICLASNDLRRFHTLIYYLHYDLFSSREKVWSCFLLPWTWLTIAHVIQHMRNLFWRTAVVFGDIFMWKIISTGTTNIKV